MFYTGFGECLSCPPVFESLVSHKGLDVVPAAKIYFDTATGLASMPSESSLAESSHCLFKTKWEQYENKRKGLLLPQIPCYPGCLLEKTTRVGEEATRVGEEEEEEGGQETTKTTATDPRPLHLTFCTRFSSSKRPRSRGIDLDSPRWRIGRWERASAVAQLKTALPSWESQFLGSLADYFN